MSPYCFLHNKIKGTDIIHAIKKGAITKLAVVVAVVITSITPYTHAELKQQLPQCRINTGKLPLQDERDVVAGEINDNRWGRQDNKYRFVFRVPTVDEGT